jgi:hypothetical protein
MVLVRERERERERASRDVLNLRVIYGKCCQHGISNASQFEFKLLIGIIKIIMHVFQSLNSDDNLKK